MKGYFKALVQKIWKEKQRKNKIDADGDNTSEPNFLEISVALDEFYCLEKLKLHCNLLSRKSMINQPKSDMIPQSISMIPAINLLLENQDFDHPMISIYQNIQELFEREIDRPNNLQQDEILNATEALIQQHQSSIDPEEQIQMYSFLTNYVTKKINSGNHSYQIKIIHLYNAILNLRYGKIKRNKLHFNANIYRNIVKIALRIDNPAFFKSLQTYGLHPKNPKIGFADREEWLNQFIEYYKSKLPAKSVDKYYRYCKSLVLFHQKEFVRAFKVIGNPIRIRGLYINLDLKILYLQILYELYDKKSNNKFWRNNNLDIFKVIDAYRKSLDRERQEAKKIGYQINYFVNFLELFRLLFNFHWNYSGVYTYGNVSYQNKKEALSNQIDECPFSYKKWFEEKFERMNH